MKLKEFLSQRTVFTVTEMDAFLASSGSGNPNTRKALLNYYRKKGRIVPVRRGLYAVVPPGSCPETSPVDPYLIAAKISDDAVLAYHTALEFHEKAYSVYTKLHYLSAHKSLPLKFQGHEFVRVPVPHRLRAKGKEMFGVITSTRSGEEIRATNLERSFVDVLDRPDLAGSSEEIWRSLEAIEYFDLEQVIVYVSLLGNAATAAKVGFYLDQHREELMVGDAHLKKLSKMRPRQPRYFSSSKRGDFKWIKKWNLLVPAEILNKTWGDVL